MQELEMDKGIDLVLKQKNGRKISSVQKLKQSCIQGNIVVEFIELSVTDIQQQMDTNAQEVQLEDGYSDGGFDIEDERAADSATNQMRMRITLDNVESKFAEMRILLMIKKVPYTHILRYLMPEGDSIKCSELGDQLDNKFPCLSD